MAIAHKHISPRVRDRVTVIRRLAVPLIERIYGDSRLDLRSQEICRAVVTAFGEILDGLLPDISGEPPEIVRTPKQLAIPEQLSNLTSLSSIPSPWIPWGTTHHDYFEYLGITSKSNTSGKYYIRGPLWNVLMRLVFMPVAIKKYWDLFDNRNQTIDASDPEFQRHVAGDPPGILDFYNRTYAGLFSSILPRIRHKPEDGSRWYLDEGVVRSLATVFASLREIETNHAGLTNTDRYLLMAALMLTSNKAVVSATTADLFGHYDITQGSTEGSWLKNPMLPVYYEILRLAHIANSGVRNYLMDEQAAIEALAKMSMDDLTIAISNVQALRDADFQIRVCEITGEHRLISVISGSGYVLTNRDFDTANPGQPLALVRMNSGSANNKLNEFAELFNRATPLTPDWMRDEWGKSHSYSTPRK